MTCEACRKYEAVDFRFARWLCGPCLRRMKREAE